MTDADFLAFFTTADDGTRVVVTSRVRFRLSPASRQLAERLLTNREKHTLFDFGESDWGERIEVWPLSEDMAIFELSQRAPRSERFQLVFAHRMHTEAQVQLLEAIAGESTLVHTREFVETDPRP